MVLEVHNTLKGEDIVWSCWKQQAVHKRTAVVVAYYCEHSESLHVEGMVKLFHQFLIEHPRVVTDELKADIYQMFRDAVKLEDKFVDLAFEMGDVEGLTKEEVKQYIRYIADRRLIQLGLKGNFGIKENPLPWLDWIISADNVTNFFEQRVADYSAAGLTGSWGW